VGVWLTHDTHDDLWRLFTSVGISSVRSGWTPGKRESRFWKNRQFFVFVYIRGSQARKFYDNFLWLVTCVAELGWKLWICRWLVHVAGYPSTPISARKMLHSSPTLQQSLELERQMDSLPPDRWPWRLAIWKIPRADFRSSRSSMISVQPCDHVQYNIVQPLLWLTGSSIIQCM